jgi:4'-phosphopantetheinyl transferase
LYHLDVSTENANWSAPQDPLSLDRDEIHVWKIALEDPALKQVDLYNRILSEDERERAGRLRFSIYRNRFVAAHAGLRKLLGRYCNAEAGDIVFEYNEHGKPAIPAGSNPGEIQFNLSHSGNIALCAITKKSTVGIDIEFLRQVARVEKILDRFFHDRERRYYYSQPEGMRNTAFLMLWTVREAYSKAMGKGISSGLKEVDLSPAFEYPPHEAASISRTNDSETWSIVQIAPGSGYVGALAYEGGAKRVSFFLT